MLGLNGDTHKHLENLKLSDKQVSHSGFPGLRGRKPWLVNEAGFNRLIWRSNKPEAREIQDWIVRDVLPGDPLGSHSCARMACTCEGRGEGLDHGELSPVAVTAAAATSSS